MGATEFADDDDDDADADDDDAGDVGYDGDAAYVAGDAVAVAVGKGGGGGGGGGGGVAKMATAIQMMMGRRSKIKNAFGGRGRWHLVRTMTGTQYGDPDTDDNNDADKGWVCRSSW